MSEGNWIVICPQSDVRAFNLWRKWYADQCVAIGWPPANYPLNAPSDRSGWNTARNLMGQIQPGDSVIPFLRSWRIGPVGRIRRVSMGDDQWDPTVPPGTYIKESSPIDSDLGRRIHVEWETSGMPEPGLVAVIPPKYRLNRPESRHAVGRLSVERFNQLVEVLGNSENWVEV